MFRGSNAESPYLLFFAIKNSAILSHWSLILFDAFSDIVDGCLKVIQSSLQSLQLRLAVDVVSVSPNGMDVHLFCNVCHDARGLLITLPIMGAVR